MMIKPICYKEVRKLRVSDHLLLYLDENNNLKRAIPDFNERFVSRSDSLIDEAILAKKIGIFKLKKFKTKTKGPLFVVKINDDGKIIYHNNYEDKENNLENFLYEHKKIEKSFKILKKKK